MPLLRALASLALLLLAGCPGPQPTTDCMGGRGQSAPNSPVEPHVFAPGEQVVLQFFPSFPLTSECVDGQPLQPDTVRVTVVDGQNRPVEVTSRLEGGPSARVEFVPPAPGSYHVSALFEPTGGLLQREVLVAIDRTQAPRLSLPAPCTQLQRTAAGTWVCDGRLFRDGQELAPLPPGRALVAGNSVWVADGQRVVLLEDTGSGPLVERASRAWEVGPWDALVADTQRLVHVAGVQLEALFLSADGTLHSPGSSTVPDVSFRRLVLAEGAVLVLSVGGTVSPSPGGADGGVPPAQGSTQVCAWTLSPTAPPAAPTSCQTLPFGIFAAMGVEEAGVWTAESSPILRRYALQADALVPATSLLLSEQMLLVLPGADLAVNAAAGQTWVVPRQEGLDLVLERSVTSGSGLLRAHAGYAWQTTGSTTTVWLR